MTRSPEDAALPLTAALRDLNKLNTFVRVAERRSFTKAATDLRTTPSVVSNRMRELEESLGFSLMNRSTHGIVLTEAGEGLYRNCLEMLERIDSYVVEERNLQSGPFGTLRVQTTAYYAQAVLAPLVMEFSRRHSGLRIHLSAVEDGSASLEESFDVIIASRKPTSPGMVGEDLGEVPYAICAAPDYLRRAGRPERPQDLRDHACLFNPLDGPKEWPFKVGGRLSHVPVDGPLSSNSDAVLLRMAAAGCGLARVPRALAADALRDGAVETVLDAATRPSERLTLYRSKAKTLPAKTTDFIDFVRGKIGGHGG
ncbi:MAG: LysR substrate-binding domain-containing protein [Alphaproteobacteria bacterium]